MNVNFASLCKKSQKIAETTAMLGLYGGILGMFLCVITIAWALLIWAINFLPLILTATPATTATYAALAADMDVLCHAMFWPVGGIIAYCMLMFVVMLTSGALALFSASRLPSNVSTL